MQNLIEDFVKYININGKSQNTVKSYKLHIIEYLKWFSDSYGTNFKRLYRENILEYKSYLINVKKYKGKNLNSKTINAKLSALAFLNKFLVEQNMHSAPCSGH